MRVNIALLTVTDTRTLKDDKSGAILTNKISESNHNLVDRKICKDNKKDIKKIIKEWLKKKNIDVIITTGGTGLTGRDVTPEAFKGIFEKEIEGFGELFRWLSFKKIGTSTIQSRAIAGVAGGTYMFALPGSTGACRDAWDEILQYQLDIRFRPCNFVEIMPRLREHELYGRAS